MPVDADGVGAVAVPVADDGRVAGAAVGEGDVGGAAGVAVAEVAQACRGETPMVSMPSPFQSPTTGVSPAAAVGEGDVGGAGAVGVAQVASDAAAQTPMVSMPSPFQSPTTGVSSGGAVGEGDVGRTGVVGVAEVPGRVAVDADRVGPVAVPVADSWGVSGQAIRESERCTRSGQRITQVPIQHVRRRRRRRQYGPSDRCAPSKAVRRHVVGTNA